MNLFFALPVIPLLGGILTMVYHFRKENTNLLSNVFIFMSLLLSIVMLRYLGINSQYAFSLFEIDKLDLIIKLKIDNLSIIMLLLINFISFILHRYSTNYLASDVTQGRFMAQLSILTASVSFLVISGNLFTAFIAWQFIGLSLYILLNHYHYDDYANKAAKKKFIINRLGDLSFLVAVILCYKYFGNSDFDCIYNSFNPSVGSHGISINLNTLIGALVFMAVMTKSAQFPFHIWLPDTMETPTPVSAIMHAGVINAGGILLTRIHFMLGMSNFLCDIIFTIGIMSILTSVFFMLSQSDVKKHLAYSTMGQMGFMVVQCSIGLYSAAIFHLVAHGFFKAFLFLSAGNNLKYSSLLEKHEPSIIFRMIVPVIFTILLVLSYYYLYNSNNLNNATIISGAFISLTIANIFSEIIKLEQDFIQKLILITLMVFGVFLYYYLSISLANILNIFNTTADNIDWYKISILVIVFLLQLAVWLKPNGSLLKSGKIQLYLFHLSRNKLFIEDFYRKVLVNPYRKIGDVLSNNLNTQIGKISLITTICLLIYAAYFGIEHQTQSNIIILISQLVFIILIASANRALNIRLLNLYLLIAQVCLVNMGLFATKPVSHTLLYFQIINSFLIFISLEMLLSRKNLSKTTIDLQKNTLSFGNMYFSILLFLWIGLPFTATFISEISVIYAIATTNLYLLIIISCGLVMLAIAILHALQEHVFAAASKNSLVNEISLSKHGFIIFSIAFNVINGIDPSWLLIKLS